MAEFTTEECLAKLEELFGHKFTFLDPEPDDEAKLVDEKTNGDEVVTVVECLDTSRPWSKRNPQSDTPIKFENDEVAPRAPTSGAYDCGKYVVGEPIAADVDFCPWKVVTTYPQNFIGKTNRPHATPYFDKILETRIWDFFYFYDPMHTDKEPHLFVPTAQLQLFLDDINNDLGVAFTIPAGVPSNRFLMRFGQGGTPRPRYLMRTEKVTKLDIKEFPAIKEEDVYAFKAAAVVRQNDIIEKMKLTRPGYKNDKSGRGQKKAEAKKKDREHMLATAHQILGLVEGGSTQSSPVLVCVDVEKVEQPPNPVSEIGIAIVDTRKITKVAPGPGGRDWWTLIEAHHLRVYEYSGLVNHLYVQGCPDRFDYGESIFPRSIEVASKLTEILGPYTKQSREIILVGHDVKGDLDACLDVGFDLRRVNGVSHTIDSQCLHMAWRNETQGRSLTMVLSDLGIYGRNFHNAGNDAVYTMRAILGVAIESLADKAAKKKGETHIPALRKEREERLAEKEKVAEKENGD